jgi:hypothetical protein
MTKKKKAPEPDGILVTTAKTIGAAAGKIAAAAGIAPPEEPKASKPVSQPAKEVVKSREGSKTEIVVALLSRDGGVTAEELMSTTGWQAHSVRGFLSGTVRKKMGLESKGWMTKQTGIRLIICNPAAES